MPVLNWPSGADKGETPTRPISEFLRPPRRFYRSVHLEWDFDDPAALEDFVVTAPIAAAFGRVLEGLRPRSGRRAWRLTGDYGSGKSSFALVLAHLLRAPDMPGLASVRAGVRAEPLHDGARLLPVLVTGSRTSIAPAVADAVLRATRHLAERDGESVGEISRLASMVDKGGDGRSLLELLGHLNDAAKGAGYSGTVLILDELGKFLEYAALHPDEEDVYLLQRLAEAATRSADSPFVVVALLHQGFHAYAERLPAQTRHEWDKIAGRLEEIVFDMPLEHTSALVSGALNVQVDSLPPVVSSQARRLAAAAAGTGWYGAAAAGELPFSPAELYPLHPALLPRADALFRPLRPEREVAVQLPLVV